MEHEWCSVSKTVPRLEDVWSMVKWPRQASKEYPLLPPTVALVGEGELPLVGAAAVGFWSCGLAMNA